MELTTDAPGIGDAVGPVHDERNMHTAFMGVLLVPLERRVAGLGPAPRIVRMRVRTTDGFEMGDSFVRSLNHEVEELHLVEHAERAALLAGAIVGHDDEHCVVQLAELLECGDESTDLHIGVLEECPVGLLQTSGEHAVVLGKRVPFLNARVAGGELRLGGDDAEFTLLGEPAFAGDIPSFVVTSTMTIEILLRRLMRCVCGTERDVGEERTIGPH